MSRATGLLSKWNVKHWALTVGVQHSHLRIQPIKVVPTRFPCWQKRIGNAFGTTKHTCFLQFSQFCFFSHFVSEKKIEWFSCSIKQLLEFNHVRLTFWPTNKRGKLSFFKWSLYKYINHELHANMARNCAATRRAKTKKTALLLPKHV